MTIVCLTFIDKAGFATKRSDRVVHTCNQKHRHLAAGKSKKDQTTSRVINPNSCKSAMSPAFLGVCPEHGTSHKHDKNSVVMHAASCSSVSALPPALCGKSYSTILRVLFSLSSPR